MTTHPREVKIDMDRRLAAALLIVGVLIGLAAGLAVAVGYARAVPASPLRLEIVPPDPIHAICPGDTVEQLFYVETDDAIEIDASVTFEAEDGTPIRNAVLGQNIVYHLGLEHQAGRRYPSIVFWSVPSLAPGLYYRTTGINTRGRSAVTTIASKEFRIPHECLHRPAGYTYTLTLADQGIDRPPGQFIRIERP